MAVYTQSVFTPALSVSPAGAEDTDRTEELEEMERSLVVFSLERGEKKNAQHNGTYVEGLLEVVLYFYLYNLLFNASILERAHRKHSQQ